MSAGQWITLAGYTLMCGFAFAAGFWAEDATDLIGFGIFAAIVAVMLIRTVDGPPRNDQP